MKDINGVEFEIEDVFVSAGTNFKIVIGFCGDTMIASKSKKTEEELKKYESTIDWTQEEITRCKLKIIKRRLLGVCDGTGREYRVGDKTASGRIVFDAIKSRNKDGMGCVFVEDIYGGDWSCESSKSSTIISSYPHELVRPKIGITVDGKPLELPLDVARARELGVVE